MGTQKNVFGEDIEECGCTPMTGIFRDGYCNTNADDIGSHTVCAQVHDEFLQYSRRKGNDLITPVPEYGFEGLTEGDRWCLCALRWKEAFDDGVAPNVLLAATNQAVLKIISLEDLKRHAIDLV